VFEVGFWIVDDLDVDKMGLVESLLKGDDVWID